MPCYKASNQLSIQHTIMQAEYEPDSKPNASAPPLYEAKTAPPAAFYTYATGTGGEDSMLFEDPSSTGHTLADFVGSKINNTLDELEENAAQAANQLAWNQTVDPLKYKITHLQPGQEVTPQQWRLEALVNRSNCSAPFGRTFWTR